MGLLHLFLHGLVLTPEGGGLRSLGDEAPHLVHLPGLVELVADALIALELLVLQFELVPLCMKLGLLGDGGLLPGFGGGQVLVQLHDLRSMGLLSRQSVAPVDDQVTSSASSGYSKERG